MHGIGAGGGIDAWIYAGDVAWTDYALELTYFGDAIVNFAVRSTGHWTNEYRVDVCATPACSDLGYGFESYRDGNRAFLGGGHFASAIQDGIVIRIEVEGNELRLYVNGGFVGSVTDPNPLPSGRFALAVSGFSSIRFDDVVVTALGCGNGALQADRGEECDDGNRDPRDGCTNACTLCGNGVVTLPEACDDGNLTDGCNADCGVHVCGDRIVASTEQCDDGNLTNGDGCDANCTLTGCGNGIVTAGEECDDGNTNPCDGCTATCQLGESCGDGHLDPACGEQCDDGNRNPFDGCTTHCTICGDGMVTPPEECDDGNTNPFDGCTTACTICGNGVVTPPEGCDDGNTVSGDGCDADCLGPGCGNGRLDADEECDDGGVCIGSPNAGTFCTAHRQCLGGECRTFGGDGCAANCTREHTVMAVLVPGVVQENRIKAGTSGDVAYSDILQIPLPFAGTRPLIVGKERDGMIPVALKAGAADYPRAQLGGNVACICLRAVAQKTCGGTLFAADGVTPATDCTPGYTEGDSVCAATLPCTFAYGEGNASAGVIGCDGLDGVDVHATQDAGGSSGEPQPPTITFSGHGGAGSAVIVGSLAVGVNQGSCTTSGNESGPDHQFCTDDDPQSTKGTPQLAPAVTGSATVQLFNINGQDDVDLGPLSVTGTRFDCNELARGHLTSGALSNALPISHVTGGDFGVAGVLAFGCGGDCNGNRQVTVDELLTMVNIALGEAPLSGCTIGEAKGDGQITVDEIVAAVEEALNGCGG